VSKGGHLPRATTGLAYASGPAQRLVAPGRLAALNSESTGRFAATVYIRCWSGGGPGAAWR
jgi:hypothetical protein